MSRNEFSALKGPSLGERFSKELMILNSKSVSRLLLFFCICTVLVGYAERVIIIQDEKIINKGLYEVNTLGREWLRSINLAHNSDYGVSVTDDVVYFRCPNQQLIGISRATYQHRLEKGRKFFPSQEEFILSKTTTRRLD